MIIFTIKVFKVKIDLLYKFDLGRRRMRNKIVLLLLAGLFLVGVAACGAVVTPSPTEAPTIAPTVVPTQVPTDTATVTPTFAPTSTPTEVVEIARPSNPGGPGKAIDLKGNPVAGKQIFVTNCVICHGQEGKGEVANAGSDDGTVPPLNPIDDTLISSDYNTYATNLDLFVEHGSTPAGTGPIFSMPNWGDGGKLTPQQIADVIAYVISLNK
jgi:mono/diheme cytochrome c family protein